VTCEVYHRLKFAVKIPVSFSHYDALIPSNPKITYYPVEAQYQVAYNPADRWRRYDGKQKRYEKFNYRHAQR
jgi:hypothetical protein